MDLGLAVVGISPDQPARQQKFDDKYNLSFPLLADPDHRVAEAYGVWAEKTSYGKKSLGIIRSSFLIDAAGKIVAAWYGVKPEDTVPKAQGAAEGKQAMRPRRLCCLISTARRSSWRILAAASF